VSLAFGLTVLTGAYAVGPISGAHFNPAVSVGLWAGGRFPASQLPSYVIAQVLGGIAGAAVFYLIASGNADFSLAGGFAANGYGEHSPGKYTLLAALVTEVVMISWRDAQASAGWLRRYGDRSRCYADSSDQHSGHEHIGESCAKHRAGHLRRRVGD
jgi:hypothetical protein